jgi:hypothetical protein
MEHERDSKKFTKIVIGKYRANTSIYNEHQEAGFDNLNRTEQTHGMFPLMSEAATSVAT